MVAILAVSGLILGAQGEPRIWFQRVSPGADVFVSYKGRIEQAEDVLPPTMPRTRFLTRVQGDGGAIAISGAMATFTDLSNGRSEEVDVRERISTQFGVTFPKTVDFKCSGLAAVGNSAYLFVSYHQTAIKQGVWGLAVEVDLSEVPSFKRVMRFEDGFGKFGDIWPVRLGETKIMFYADGDHLGPGTLYYFDLAAWQVEAHKFYLAGWHGDDIFLLAPTHSSAPSTLYRWDFASRKAVPASRYDMATPAVYSLHGEFFALDGSRLIKLPNGPIYEFPAPAGTSQPVVLLCSLGIILAQTESGRAVLLDPRTLRPLAEAGKAGLASNAQQIVGNRHVLVTAPAQVDHDHRAGRPLQAP